MRLNKRSASKANSIGSSVKTSLQKPLTKRNAAKKSKVKKQSTKKTSLVKEKNKLLGIVTHYFPHVRAAVIKLKGPLSNGEAIKIKGHTTDFTQVITSMQIDRVPITGAKKGDEIGLQVNSRVRQQDKVYKA